MGLNKGLTYAFLSAVIFMPWNATAVNHYNFKQLLHKTNFTQTTGRAISDLAESLLVQSLLEITQGKNKQALSTINELIRKTPNFKLAYLVRGDLLTAQAQYLQSFGNTNSQQTEAIQDLQDEARVRIERYLSDKNQDKVPDLLLSPSKNQSHVIVVDTDKSRLYLYKNEPNGLNYVADYYITVGKNGVVKQTEGDKRTPIGVYFTSPKLSQPLPDMYGDAAYPLNYPNEWDVQHNKSGSGIWLHGTPSSTYSRAPRASDGCVVLANEDLRALSPILKFGKTPVIIANNLKWLESENSSSEKQTLQVAIGNWLSDWQSQDTSKYLSHYSHDFSTNGINYQKWSDHKYLVQASKPKVDISISDVSIFTYPSKDEKLVVVDFMQNFKSPNLSNKMQKRQYWIQENNTWKIIYEGAV